jgi:glucuronate isomerase
MSKFISKSAVRAASTSAQTTKAAGDISSVFPSLRPDYKPEPLPARFQELKARIFEKNKDAITRSWERLLPSLDEEVQKIKAKGSDVCAHVTRNVEQKTDIQILDYSLN